MTEPTFDELLTAIQAGHDLDAAAASSVIRAIMSGDVEDDRIEQFLRAMIVKGESVDELVGGATAMRENASRIACDFPDAIDTCGTGGDGISTFNVSTAAALVAAGAGARVAKHGNRSNSRASGSAEVLAALGVNIQAAPLQIARCIREIGIGFLFAPALHPAMSRVAAARRRIGRPTIFNLLGPLSNPAFVRRQIIGVPRDDLMEKMAQALQRLGADRAWVVHGDDGLCDLTITGPSRYVDVTDQTLTHHVLQPRDVGLQVVTLDALRVTDPDQSAAVIRSVLDGDHGPPRDHTILNAAAALVVAGIAPGLTDGVTLAARSIDSGRGRFVLEGLIRITGESP